MTFLRPIIVNGQVSQQLTIAYSYKILFQLLKAMVSKLESVVLEVSGLNYLAHGKPALKLVDNY